ncbi:ubiquitin carboxyl-terminal hydrolase 20 isoform X2 [Nematostella vectensis]|uniref:ubiquitin carboxyl-terminal hydrolase 20 isoform X2 n=1 Tax=Nematostella vectensis TaxID=45351 RepID=UPI002076E827|nr:ubiquitin carboxyl-terminal hydrolase 20 isoform X2 [Nematostella vectensis]
MRCPHLSSIKKVNVEDLKMRVKGECDGCEKQQDLWACLQSCCSYVGCGRCGRNHIELHNQETDHQLCINLESYNIWCFSCQTDVDPSSTSTESSSSSSTTPTKSHKVGCTLEEEDYFELEQGLKPRGLCGLMNIGNTCYMNAALQALSNCPPLTQFFLECNTCISDAKHPGVAINYYNVVRELWSKKRSKYIVPTQLLRSIRAVNSQFRGYGQQDAQEFLRCIMDQLHEELKQPITTPASDSDSSDDDDDPNIQAKSRLLGGTSLVRQSSGITEDEDMDTGTGRSVNKYTPIHPHGTPSSDTDEEMQLDSQQASVVHDPSEVQIDIDMAEEDANLSAIDNSKASNNELMSPKDGENKRPVSANDAKKNSSLNRFKRSTTKKDKKKTFNYRSIITDLFDGKVQSSVQCLTCNRVSSRIETFQDLSLPIPGKDELTVIHASQCAPLVTCSRGGEFADLDKGWMLSIFDWVRRWLFGPQVSLQDCLSAFFSADELKGDNMYSCEKCQKLRNGIKLCKVLQLPEILCVHLKRFRHEMYFSSKISHFISFPITGLDMKPFIVKESRGLVEKSTCYDLTAIITHHGNVGAGHYIAFAKNYISNTWFEFNDSWVTEVSESFVSSVEAYVLFYRRTSEEASKERQSFAIMMNKAKNQPRCYFISKLWMTKFHTCVDPGPISNTDFICPHSGIHPRKHDKVRDLVIAVPAVIWEHLTERYGGGPAVTSLKPCTDCQADLEELERRRNYEVETFKKLNTDFPAADNVDVFCLSMRWFRQWEMFVKGQQEDPPGPIDNSNIIIIKGNQKMLRSAADYGQVSSETWQFLNDTYGGGPSFVLEAEMEDTK